jgi:2-keto-3-deoxy-L-fuconate dehydrogenase
MTITSPQGKLAGRCAVVTGAASGIGSRIAQTFVSEGAYIVAVDRHSDRLRAQESEAPTGRWLSIECDVGSEAQTSDAVAQAIVAFGGIDILVTAAGVSVGGTATTTSLVTWEAVLRVNLTGTFLWAKACIPHMIARGGGSIVTVASQRAVAGGDGNASYVTSKGGVLSLTRSIALDYADQGIRANALLPGAIETEMLTGSFQRTSDERASRDRSLARHPLHRFGQTAEVANAALFLASSDSSFVTGVHLPVDGGWLAA